MMRRWFHAGRRAFTLIELMIVVAIVGVLAALAVYGVRKYMANAKTAEARNSLGQISKAAAVAFERETATGSIVAAKATIAVGRALCASASQPVPMSALSIKGVKYQSSQAPRADWSIDASSFRGFSCLRFAMSDP